MYDKILYKFLEKIMGKFLIKKFQKFRKSFKERLELIIIIKKYNLDNEKIKIVEKIWENSGLM